MVPESPTTCWSARPLAQREGAEDALVRAPLEADVASTQAPCVPGPSDRALIELSHALPSDAVITDDDVRAAFSRDESEAEPTMPAAVVRVRSTRDAQKTMEIAHRHAISVTPRAAGTGRVGGAVPKQNGWVLAFERFDRILDLEEDDGVVVVEPGAITGRVHEVAEASGLFYGPDPSSLASCTIGGNVATNAGGPRAVKYGVTRDWVRGLEVVLADGTVLELGGRTHKSVTGYDLRSLVVGSEGTLALVTRATLRLIPKPAVTRTLIAFFASEAPVALAVRECLRSSPRVLELLDSETLAVVREAGGAPVPSAAQCLLLVELDGDEGAIERALAPLGHALERAGAIEVLVAKHGGDRERLWGVRREMSRALRRRAAHKLSEDVVVPRSKLGALLVRCRSIAAAQQIRMPAYGHAGDGNLHVNFLWDHDDERERVDAAIEQLFRAVVELGGTLSGEHGIGVLKAPYLSIEQSPELIALQRRIKAELDPKNILNPGTIFARSHGPC